MRETQTKEKWLVTWFPPEGDKTRIFATEKQARGFAASVDVEEWNPVLEHLVVSTTTVSELLPLDGISGI